MLARDGRRCRVRIDGTTICPRHNRTCDPVCTDLATHAHHTRGKAVTGDDPRYMVAACEACNLHVGDPRKHDPKPRPRKQW